jgi:hypothetical protein
MENRTILLTESIRIPGKKPAVITLEIYLCSYYVNLYHEGKKQPLFIYKCMEYNNALNYMVIAKNRYERIENA